MSKKTQQKPQTKTKTPADDGLGTALYGLAKEIEGVAEELHPLYHIEQMGDYVGDVATALNGLSNTTALSVIARYGTDEDRAMVVAILKRGYDEFRD